MRLDDVTFVARSGAALTSDAIDTYARRIFPLSGSPGSGVSCR